MSEEQEVQRPRKGMGGIVSRPRAITSRLDGRRVSPGVRKNRAERPLPPVPAFVVAQTGMESTTGKRTKEEIEYHRSVIAQMYCQAYTIQEIADYIGRGVQTIQYDLDAIRALWKTRMVTDWVEGKNRALAKIDALESEYWAAYRRSQTKKIKTRTGSRSGKVVTDEAFLIEETMIGDPRWLEGVQWCIHERAELLGLADIAQMQNAASLAGERTHEPIDDETRLAALAGEFLKSRRLTGAAAGNDGARTTIVPSTAIERGSRPA